MDEGRESNSSLASSSALNQRRRSVRQSLRRNFLRCAPSENIDVGRCMRAIREARGFSIRALAEKSGLAVNTLSLIENGKSSPSVSTLQRLAATLEVPITAFFETSSPPEQGIVYLKEAKRPGASFDHGILEDLGVGLAEHIVEPFVVTLEPHASSGEGTIVHKGIEFVFCLQGHIEYTIDEHTFLLEAGDSLLFESHLPHCWRNPDETRSRALLVLCPTEGNEDDLASDAHFASNTFSP